MASFRLTSLPASIEADNSEDSLESLGEAPNNDSTVIEISEVFSRGNNPNRSRSRSPRRSRRQIGENVEYINLGEIDLSEEPYEQTPTNHNAFPRNHDPAEIIDLCTPPVSGRVRPRHYGPCRRSLPDSEVYIYIPSISEMRDSNSYLTASNRPTRLSVPILETTSTNGTTATETARNDINQQETILTKSDNKNNNNDNSNNNNVYTHKNVMCAVCLESYVSREPTATKCGHIFCKNCINEAIRLTKKCPVCQAKLRLNHLLRLFM